MKKNIISIHFQANNTSKNNCYNNTKRVPRRRVELNLDSVWERG
jgi:hypothetical protein